MDGAAPPRDEPSGSRTPRSLDGRMLVATSYIGAE
jgi:hypothetical protein